MLRLRAQRARRVAIAAKKLPRARIGASSMRGAR